MFYPVYMSEDYRSVIYAGKPIKTDEELENVLKSLVKQFPISEFEIGSTNTSPMYYIVKGILKEGNYGKHKHCNTRTRKTCCAKRNKEKTKYNDICIKNSGGCKIKPE